MASFGWLLVFLGFLGTEVFWGHLVSLWFAVGSLGAWLGKLAGISMEGQLGIFVAVSFLALFFIRPAAFLLQKMNA
jgi:membrane protein implicated in regulation of membrane protease activity